MTLAQAEGGESRDKKEERERKKDKKKQDENEKKDMKRAVMQANKYVVQALLNLTMLSG